MSEMGQTRRFRHVRGTSALPPIATIKQTCRQVGSVPRADNRSSATTLAFWARSRSPGWGIIFRTAGLGPEEANETTRFPWRLPRPRHRPEICYP